MTEILKRWLSIKLKKNLSYEIEDFGNAVRDGILISELLFSYGIITKDQLDFIVRDVKVNFAFIKMWLKSINIEITNEDIECIIDGRGSVALRLFYQMFLELDDKHNNIAIKKIYNESQSIRNQKRTPSGDNILTELETIVKVSQFSVNGTQAGFNRLSKTNVDCNILNYTYEELQQMEEKAMIDIIKSKSTDKARLNEYEIKIRKMKKYKKNLPEFHKKVEKDILDRMNVICQEGENEINAVKTLLCLSQYEKQMATQLLEAKQEMNRIYQNRIKEQKELDHQRDIEFGEALERMRIQMLEMNEEKIKYRETLHLQILKDLNLYTYEICKATVLSLFDYAWKFIEFKDMTNETVVPRLYLNEWKNVFIKMEYLINKNSNEGRSESLSIEELEKLPEIKPDVLDEKEFFDYHTKTGLWDYVALNIVDDTENSQWKADKMMAKILNNFIATNSSSLSASHPVPRKKVATILLQDSELTKLSTVLDYLAKMNIRIINLNDAIFLCFRTFKKEATEYEEFDREKYKVALNNLNIDIESFMLLMSELENVDSKICVSIDAEQEKETQTPMKIPTASRFSHAAELGMMAVGALNESQYLSDFLLSSMFVEYLKYIVDEPDDGWLLKDFPENYEQARIIQSLLMGNIVKDPSVVTSELNNNFDSMKNSENYALRLYTYPNEENSDNNTSYFTAFIKLKKCNSIKQEKFIWKLTEENSTELERYYADEGINYSIYFENFDDETISFILKYIMGNTEIYSNYVLGGEDDDFLRCETKSHSSRLKVIKGKHSIQDGLTSVKSLLSEDDDKCKGNYETVNQTSQNNIDLHVSCVFLPLSENMIVELGSSWKNLEFTYIEDLKHIFYRKRHLLSKIIPYYWYIRNALEKQFLVNSTKQDLVSSFQKKYNTLDASSRQDSQTKAHIYCEIQKLQNELVNICKSDKTEGEELRIKLIQDKWAVQNLTTMVNVFVNFMQVELNRSQQTLNLFHDYYIGMINSIPANGLIQPFELIKLSPDSSIDFSDGKVNETAPQKKEKQPKSAKKKVSTVEIIENVNTKTVSSQLNDSLTSNEVMAGNNDPFITYLNVSKSYVEKYNAALMNFYNEIIKKEMAKFSKVKRDSAAKAVSGKTEISENVILNALDEWKFLLSSELCRLQLRVCMVHARGSQEVALAEEYIFKAFKELHQNIIDKYTWDTNLIEFLKVFQLAADKECKILTPILFSTKNLAGDIEKIMNGIMERDDARKFVKLNLPFNRLEELRVKLMAVANNCSILKRPFIIILQNYFLLDPETPEDSDRDIWFMLQPKDIEVLVDIVYGNIDYVDWRDFLILCIGLDFPNEEEIMILRKSFLICDEFENETISRSQYCSITWWFEASDADFLCSSYLILFKEFMFELFKVGEGMMNYTALLVALCRNEDPVVGFGMALSLAMGSLVCISTEDGELYLKQQETERIFRGEAHKSALSLGDNLMESLVDRTINTCNGVYIEQLISPHDSLLCFGKGAGEPGGIKNIKSASRKSLLSCLSKDEAFVEMSISQSLSIIEQASTESERISAVKSYKVFSADKSYCISEEIVRRVLLVCLPWNCREEFESPFREITEGLNRAFSDLKYCEETDMVLTHKLLEHHFIKQFIESTNKFKIFHLCRIAVNMVQRREDEFDLNFL